MEMIVVMCPQNSFLDPKGSVYMGEKAEVLKVRLVDYLSGYGGKRVFFREKHAESDTFFSSDRTHSVANTYDYNVCNCFKGLADLFFDKIRYSGFYETGFDVMLKQNHIQNVILAGVETHTSLLFTSEEFRNRGMSVILLEPLTASRDDYMHSVAITLMANNLGVKISA
jgi:nicotinamidase-related amidase